MPQERLRPRDIVRVVMRDHRPLGGGCVVASERHPAATFSESNSRVSNDEGFSQPFF